MSTFKIPPAEIKSLRRRMLRRLVPILTLVLLFVGLYPLLLDRVSFDRGFAATSALVVAAIVFGTWRAISRASHGWLSYELEVSDDLLIRRQAFLPELTLPRSEITSIVEGRDGSLAVRGEKADRLIPIPSEIERYEELHLLLSGWRPIEASHGIRHNSWSVFLATVATLALLGVVTFSSQALIVVPTALVLTVLYLHFWSKIRKNSNVDERVKRPAWHSWLFLIFIITRLLQVLDLLP